MMTSKTNLKKFCNHLIKTRFATLSDSYFDKEGCMRQAIANYNARHIYGSNEWAEEYVYTLDDREILAMWLDAKQARKKR